MIHKIDMNGYKIVLDVESGAVHVVDEIVFDILECYNADGVFDASVSAKAVDKYGDSVMAEAVAEIEQLKREGLLFADELPETARRAPVVKALCLHVAHDCNLKCRYCFAGEGEYCGERSLMSAQVGKEAIDFLIDASGSRRNLEVDFFGGEPLLNFRVIKEVVAYAREAEKPHNKNIRFTLTTNGILLDAEVAGYVNEHMQNVVLSIDGRPGVNDSMRVRADGGGSYSAIVPRFQRLAESRGQSNYYVRGTFTRHNLDFASDVLHLADLGFKQISVEPVVADPKADYALQPEDVPGLCAEYERLALEMLEREENGRAFNFFHFMIDLTGGPCVAKRVAGCGAGSEYLAVTPEGELYPCHQFVGRHEFRIGDLASGVTDTVLRQRFYDCGVYSKPECKRCWAKYYCSGGCAANAYNAHGDILKPYGLGCELQKKRIECAIMMKAHQVSWV